MSPAVGAAPRRVRNATLLWAAQLVSATGDVVFLPCVAWLAGRSGADGAALGVGLTVSLATLPFLVFGPAAGALVDRLDRRRLMVASDLARAAVLMGFVGLAALGVPLGAGALVALGFLVGALSTPFGPARDALLPDIAEGGSLARWNALVQTSAQVAQVLGLLAGAWVLADAGGQAVGEAALAEERGRVLALLAWDGASFVLSALLLLALRLPPGAEGPRVRTSFAQTLGDGLAYVRGDRFVRGLLALTALDNLAIMGPAIVGATLLVQHTFHLSASALAGFEAAMAGGMLLGAVLLAVGGKRLRLLPLLLVAMALDGLTYLPFAWIEDWNLGLVAIACHGICIPAIVVARTSLLHRHVPPERRGQVFALVGMTVAGMTAVSAFASGWIAHATSPRALFLLAGILGTLCGLLGGLWVRR
jgi:MFS transporter, DHA3 family, macrolide efflux protein